MKRLSWRTAHSGAIHRFAVAAIVVLAAKEMAFTQTPSPAPLPALLEPSALRFDVGVGVPEDEIEVIKSGIDIARLYLQELIGGDIPSDVRRTITVKIVATGKGNQDPGGGGACCTGLDTNGLARLFIDVKHPHYDVARPAGPWSVRANKQKSAAHEYTHAWQNWLGCLGKRYASEWTRFEGWLVEGVAEYVAYGSLIRVGAMRTEDVGRSQLTAAISSGQMGAGLRGLEYLKQTYVIWPGNLGYLAVEMLVRNAPAGPISLRRHCLEVRSQGGVDQAFVRAFGTSKAAFYQSFAAYVNELAKPSTSSPTAQVLDQRLVVAGEGIGRWTLAMTIEDLVRMNGPQELGGAPAIRLAASERADQHPDIMLHSWGRLRVDAGSRDGRALLYLAIRTGSDYRTAQGITFGARRSDIEEKYGRPPVITQWGTGSQQTMIYDARGLAFELDGDSGVVAFLVFRRGTANSIWKI
ncbi:MAG: hypothetical protein ACRDF5_04120 [bacterium]